MMQMSAAYPRRYSSSSRHGTHDELDYELDFNDASRTSSPVSTRSEGPRRREREHRHRSSQSEDIRRKYARLKSELELERTRTKQMHKEKTEELRQLRELFEKDRKQELDSLQSKLEREKQKELAKIRENLVKEKDFELQQVLKYKDEELKHLKSVLARQGSHPQSQGSTDAKTETAAAASTERKAEKSSIVDEELKKMKEIHAELEKKYKRKCEDEARKEKEFVKMKEGYDQELRSLLSESKRLAMGNLQKLKKAELALSEGGVSEDESVASLALTLVGQSMGEGAGQGDGEALSAQLNRALMLEQGTTQGEDAVNSIAEKREEREKERTLQKKIGELQTQIQRLERRISLLRTENDTLKKKQDDQKPLEEKIKTLKKRNGELAAIARRLEEKAKSLQQENLKKGQTGTGAESEHLKRLFARQRAKDLADHAKGMLSKDREIEDLRKKCQELADQLSNGEYLLPQNAQMYEEKEELVTIIKQAAKERLQIERQLAKVKPLQVVQSGDAERARQLQELEEANAELQGEIVKLNELRRQTDYLDRELKHKDEECTTLRKDIEVVKKANKDLEEELYESAAKNSQLVTELSEAQRKLQDFDQVKEECSSLRLNLTEVQQERQEAEDRVTSLQTRVDSLENLVKELQESSEELQHLEEDYKQALQRLTLKQQEIDVLQEAQEESKVEHQRAVADLQARLSEVQEQCRAQERRQEELNAELTSLRVAARGEVTYKATVSAQVQTEAVPVISTGTDATPLPQPPPLLHDNSQGVGDGASLASYTNALRQNSARGRGVTEDPELKEISQKLQELEADSDEDLHLQEEKDDSGMESNKDSRAANEVSLSDSRLSSLARKGPIQVYVAKYSYDPFKYSPNENPETELPLNAGDYVLVLGDMDEDGFFEGELIDGRRGLVPSNFIERVAEEDLADFHAAMAMASCHSDDSTVNSVQHDLDFSSTEEQDRVVVTEPDDRPVKGDNLDDLEDIEEVDEDSIPISDRLRNSGDTDKMVAYPRELKLDRQLSSSIMISWRPPEGVNPVDIKSYHVFVDADFKTSVRGNERTKALVENIDISKPHRVSVRCISIFGQSREQQCTMLIGKDMLPTPSDLRVSDVTANAASISWMPGNSNYQHALIVDGKEARVVKPGVYRHTLTGLTPDSVHKVVVYAKSLTSSYEDEKTRRRLSVSAEFRTKPGGGEGEDGPDETVNDSGLPDPPLNVLVEAGPREGSLLVTWLPVTITTSGFSNGAVVEGYVVYTDGKLAKTARGPINDHCVLDVEDLVNTAPKHLTVRTVTHEGKESMDSDVVRIPPALLREMNFSAPKTLPTIRSSRKSPKSPVAVGENAGNDTDEEIEAAFRDVVAEEAASDLSPVVEPQFAEPFLESSSSELSDIPEVEEELLAADEANESAGPLGSAQSPIEPTNQPRKFVSQTEQGKKSPKPTPRRLMPVHTGAPEGSQSEKLLTPRERVAVPAIEITRDSSTERGNSFEEEVDSSNRNQPKLPGGDAPHGPRSPPSKYGANKDGRDGFREPVQSPTSPSRPSPNPSPRAHHRSGARRSPSDGHGRRRTPEYEENGDNDSISGEINPPVDDNKVRLFIALFDYEPSEMSPNVESLDEELPFREGHIIKVFGEKDADGFYRGECGGRIGYVPCNMVSEVQIDDPELVEQLLHETQGNPVTKSHLSIQDEESSPRQAHLTPNGIVPPSSDSAPKRMVALYDYDPQELSPNVDSDLELAFKAGDIIYIHGEMDEDGFFMGEISGRRGYVPSNFLQEAPLPGPGSTLSGLSDDEALESASMVSPSRSGESFSTTSRQSEGLSNTGRQDQLSPRLETITMESVIQLQPTSPSRHISPAPEEDKPKKKGGILNKGKNILKKFAR